MALVVVSPTIDTAAQHTIVRTVLYEAIANFEHVCAIRTRISETVAYGTAASNKHTTGFCRAQGPFESFSASLASITILWLHRFSELQLANSLIINRTNPAPAQTLLLVPHQSSKHQAIVRLMSEVEFLRESLRKAQQERDHYRSETARLRTENAKLQNDIDAVFAQLSDMDGLRRMHEVSGELNAGANANSLVDVLVKVDPDEPDPEVIDLCSENEQDPAAAVRLKSLKRPRSPPTVRMQREFV
ncbi:hypothetical protein BS17DRAFT_328314 [Gyrodon lividus]|nr:hypothetical protein BS17DRAFT_328314 [Gyrodon lividus]